MQRFYLRVRTISRYHGWFSLRHLVISWYESDRQLTLQLQSLYKSKVVLAKDEELNSNLLKYDARGKISGSNQLVIVVMVIHYVWLTCSQRGARYLLYKLTYEYLRVRLAISNKQNESMLKHMVIKSYLRGYVTMMISDEQVNSGP